MIHCRLFCVGFLIAALAGCAFQRADDAAEAKKKMVGMTKEQVLICMGPPKQSRKVNETEVWSFLSNNGQTESYGIRPTTNAVGFGMKQKSFCTVNVIMHSDEVIAVQYSGPSGGLLAKDEQCGYAVEHCIED